LPLLLKTQGLLDAPAELQKTLSALKPASASAGGVLRRSKRGSAASSSKRTIATVVAVVFVVTGGTALILNERQASTKPSAVKSPPPVSESIRMPFSRTWDFNTPVPPKDMRVMVGKWHWMADGGSDGSGCWETDTDLFIAELDIPIER